MTDHDRMDTFETRLAALVRSYTEPAAKPTDPLVTARTAIASAGRGGVLGQLWPVGVDRRVVWLLLLAVLLVTLGALAVTVGSGPSRLVQAPGGPAQIVFVRDGDLFVADIDGSGQRRIASGDAGDAKFGYIMAAWSPDMRHIAAVRDVGGRSLTPGVDLMTADGALVRTVGLEPGCGPSVSWSPDSTEVAIGTCPADVPRDTLTPVDSGIGLVIAGLDASADRSIALPPEWRSVASARHEVWIRPDLWARWSPDGRWIERWVLVGKDGRYLVAADGSGTRPIEGLTESLSWVQALDRSSDGRTLAIAGDWGRCAKDLCVGIIDAEGGQETALVAYPSDPDPETPGRLVSAKFSPDGQALGILGQLPDFGSEPPIIETYTLFAYDLQTARLTELTGEIVTRDSVAWTPDGGRLLYLVRDADASTPSWTIHLVDASGGGQSAVVVRGVGSFDVGSVRD